MKIIDMIEECMNVAVLPVMLVVLLLWLVASINEIRKKGEKVGYYLLCSCIYVLMIVLYLLIKYVGNVKANMLAGTNIYVNISFMLGMILIYIATVMMYKIVNAYKKESEVIEKINALNDEDIELKRLYESTENVKRQLSYIRHDLANHIQIINSVNSDSKKDGFEKVANILHRADVSKKVGNPVINVVLEGMIKKCTKRGIKINADINLLELENVECEELLVIIKIMFEMISEKANKNDVISVNLKCRDDRDKSVKVVFKMIGKDSNDREKLEVARYIIRNMDGDIVIDTVKDKIMVTGMVEVRKVC